MSLSVSFDVGNWTFQRDLKMTFAFFMMNSLMCCISFWTVVIGISFSVNWKCRIVSERQDCLNICGDFIGWGHYCSMTAPLNKPFFRPCFPKVKGPFTWNLRVDTIIYVNVSAFCLGSTVLGNLW